MTVLAELRTLDGLSSFRPVGIEIREGRVIYPEAVALPIMERYPGSYGAVKLGERHYTKAFRLPLAYNELPIYEESETVMDTKEA